jgi:hypothetical protein
MRRDIFETRRSRVTIDLSLDCIHELMFHPNFFFFRSGCATSRSGSRSASRSASRTRTTRRSTCFYRFAIYFKVRLALQTFKFSRRDFPRRDVPETRRFRHFDIPLARPVEISKPVNLEADGETMRLGKVK